MKTFLLSIILAAGFAFTEFGQVPGGSITGGTTGPTGPTNGYQPGQATSGTQNQNTTQSEAKSQVTNAESTAQSDKMRVKAKKRHLKQTAEGKAQQAVKQTSPVPETSPNR
jgi:hypothetical protein